MQQRIREAFAFRGSAGLVRGAGGSGRDLRRRQGQEHARQAASREDHRPRPGRKDAVVGDKYRATNKVAAKVVDSVDAKTLAGFVDGHAADEAMVYTDGATAYRGRKNHEAVHHSVGEYVRGKAHTNRGILDYLVRVVAQSVTRSRTSPTARPSTSRRARRARRFRPWHRERPSS